MTITYGTQEGTFLFQYLSEEKLIKENENGNIWNNLLCRLNDIFAVRQNIERQKREATFNR